MNKHSYTVEDKLRGVIVSGLDLSQLLHLQVWDIKPGPETDIHVYYTECIDPSLPEEEIIDAMSVCIAEEFTALREIRKHISQHVLENPTYDL